MTSAVRLHVRLVMGTACHATPGGAATGAISICGNNTWELAPTVMCRSTVGLSNRPLEALLQERRHNHWVVFSFLFKVPPSALDTTDSNTKYPPVRGLMIHVVPFLFTYAIRSAAWRGTC